MCFPFPLLPSSCPSGRSGEAADVLGQELPQAGQPLCCSGLHLLGSASPPLPSPPRTGRALAGRPLPLPLLSSHLSGSPRCCRLSIVHSWEVFSQEPSLPRAQGEPGIPRLSAVSMCEESGSPARGPDFCRFPPWAFDTDLIGEGARRGDQGGEGFVFLCPPPRPWRAGNRNPEQISKATGFSTSGEKQGPNWPSSVPAG